MSKTRAIEVFRVQVALSGEGRQFGAKLDPPVTLDNLDDLMLLIRNTFVEVLTVEEA
jgi:hypothetical protein